MRWGEGGERRGREGGERGERGGEESGGEKRGNGRRKERSDAKESKEERIKDKTNEREKNKLTSRHTRKLDIPRIPGAEDERLRRLLRLEPIPLLLRRVLQQRYFTHVIHEDTVAFDEVGVLHRSRVAEREGLAFDDWDEGAPGAVVGESVDGLNDSVCWIFFFKSSSFRS